MALLIGALLALGVAGFAAAVGFDRARAFYPVAMIVIASYYVLFAVMAGAGAALGLEIALFGLFAAAAVLGFRKNLWLVVVALLAHGVLDLFHAGLVANPGVPDWWPAFCLAYDVLAGACLAVLLLPATRPHVVIELRAAAMEQDAGRMDAAFLRLERAHVLGQRSTIEHVRVHWLMLRWSYRQRDVREGLGQMFRLIGAAVATPFGLIPIGNTGGSNVSPFRPMEVPADLASVMTAVRKRRLRAVLAATLAAGAMFGAPASAATQEVRLATVDGRNVAYRVLGQGKPVVVLISGLGWSGIGGEVPTLESGRCLLRRMLVAVQAVGSETVSPRMSLASWLPSELRRTRRPDAGLKRRE